jgi:hypothetical protein
MKPLPSSPTARRALAFDALLEGIRNRDEPLFERVERIREIGVQLKGHKL